MANCAWIRLALALLYAGCGALDAPAIVASPGSIKIGVMERRNPRLAAFSARLAADEINKAGGLLGKHVEILVTTDRLCDPEHSPKVMAQLVRQGVVAVVAGLCSAAMLSDLETVAAPEKRNIIIVSPSSSSPVLSGKPNFFRTIPSDAVQGPVLAELVWREGRKTAALIHRDDIYGNSLADAFALRYVELGGRLLTRVSYTKEQESALDAPVDALFSKGLPAAVVVVGLSVDAAAVTRSIETSKKFASGAGVYASETGFGSSFLLNASRQIANGMKGLFPAPTDGDPNYQRFFRAYRNAVGESPGEGLDQLDIVGRAPRYYDGVYLLALAIQKGRSTATESIRKHIVAVSGTALGVGEVVRAGEFARATALLRDGREINYEGASGPIDLDATSDPSRGSYLQWRITNGHYVIESVLTFAPVNP